MDTAGKKLDLKMKETTVVETPSKTHRLQVGDLVEIEVLYDPGMKQTAQIDSHGMVSLPFIGPLRAAGSTPAELRQALLGHCSPILKLTEENLLIRVASGAEAVSKDEEHTSKYLIWPCRDSSEDLSARFAESYQTLRTNLLLRMKQNEKSFLVTSSNPEEGKSTIAANLATFLAASNRRVLLVDGDLRRPTVHSLYSISNGQGLAELLMGAARLEEVLHRVGAGLTVLTSGRHVSNPQVLLAPDRFGGVLAILQDSYDFVIIDSAPVLHIADTLLVAQQVDGVILVIKSGEVTKAEALLAKEHLDSAHANIVGCVLNFFASPHRASYYPYYYYPRVSE